MLYVSIGFALALGLGFALNAWVIRFCIKEAGFTAMQLSIDALMVSAIPMLTMFIYY